MSELKQMATEAGSFTITAKVSTIEEKQGSKGSYYLVFLEGYASRLFSKDKPPFAEGYEGPVQIDAKNGDNGMNFFLGRPKTGGGGGGGFGGGKGYQPKSKEEIHSSCLAGIIKSGLDREKSAEDIRPYLALYIEFIGVVS